MEEMKLKVKPGKTKKKKVKAFFKEVKGMAETPLEKKILTIIETIVLCLIELMRERQTPVLKIVDGLEKEDDVKVKMIKL